MARDMHELTDTVCMQNKSIHRANETLNQLENAKKEQQFENSNLKRLVHRLKNKPSYIPERDDPVDIALADYLNTVNPRLKVPVQREEAGVYCFGTKRVFVKLEMGKLIFRVGGGFMQIEDFVQLYSSAELEKFEQQLRDKAQNTRESIYGKYAAKLITQKHASHSSMKDLSNAKKFTSFYGVQKKPLKRSVSPKA